MLRNHIQWQYDSSTYITDNSVCSLTSNPEEIYSCLGIIWKFEEMTYRFYSFFSLILKNSL